MSKQGRTFSAEFKREAATLVLDQRYTVNEACQSLGLVDSALRRWVKQLQQERNGVTPQSKGKALTPEQQKIQELQGRINCWDKAPIERLFRRLKIEWIPSTGYMCARKARPLFRPFTAAFLASHPRRKLQIWGGFAG